MAYAPPALLDFAYKFEDRISSAVFSGIVADLSTHSYGFHLSARQLSFNRGDYSLADADNWAGGQADPDAAAGVDESMSTADMITVTRRLVASWEDPNDHRLDCLYSFIGTLDGRTVVRYVCHPDNWGGPFYDADDSHLWHLHLSVLRNHVHDAAALAGVLSVITGGAPAANPAAAVGEGGSDMYIAGNGAGSYVLITGAQVVSRKWDGQIGPVQDRGEVPEFLVPQTVFDLLNKMPDVGATVPVPPTAQAVAAAVTAVLPTTPTPAQIAQAVVSALGSLQISLTPVQVQTLGEALVKAKDNPLDAKDVPTIVAALEAFYGRAVPRT